MIKMQSVSIFAAMFRCQRQRSRIMPRLLKEQSLSPRCETCGRDTARLGKLPQIGLRPLVHVYKCGACNQIMSIEPDQQDGPAPA
jgi:hypothetical protein